MRRSLFGLFSSIEYRAVPVLKICMAAALVPSVIRFFCFPILPWVFRGIVFSKLGPVIYARLFPSSRLWAVWKKPCINTLMPALHPHHCFLFWWKDTTLWKLIILQLLYFFSDLPVLFSNLSSSLRFLWFYLQASTRTASNLFSLFIKQRNLGR